MYCTNEDVIAAAGVHLGDSVLGEMMEVEASALPTHPDIAKAVLSASRRIDSYLSVRYPVPLPVLAPSLRVTAEDLALYFLFRLRRLGDMQHIKERFDEQIAWLKEVRDAKENVPEMHSSEYADGGGAGAGAGSVGNGAGNEVHVISTSSQFNWANY